jgi:hypothetical protein
VVDHVDRDHVHVKGDVVEDEVAEAREQGLLVDLTAGVGHVVALEVIHVVDRVAVQGGTGTGREAEGEEIHLGQCVMWGIHWQSNILLQSDSFMLFFCCPCC